jgi:hypothetical protein
VEGAVCDDWMLKESSLAISKSVQKFLRQVPGKIPARAVSFLVQKP